MWENIDKDRHYIGVFNLDNNEIPGEIVYNKSKGMILLSLTQETKGLGKHYWNKSCIKGKLTSGGVLTLFDNACTKNHTQSFRYQTLHYLSKYMTLGNDYGNEHQYNKLVCIIENGVEWSGLTQIEVELLKELRLQKVEPLSFGWFGSKITFSTSVTNELWGYPRNEVSKVIERLNIEIESAEKRDINYFIAIRDNVLSMISFAIKNNVNIEEQFLYDYDYFYFTGDKVVPKMHYKFNLITSEPSRVIFRSYLFDYNFTLKELNNGTDISDKLFKLSPIFNLYASFYKYEDMPNEMIFLNMVQALETFHARFFYEDKKELYVKSVEERFASLPNYDLIKKLLLSDSQIDKNCNYIILVSRLYDLFIGDYDGLFYEFYGDDPEYAQRIADTRHYYTHYSKSKEKKALRGDDLNDATYILKLLLEYNICKVLGIDKKENISNAIKAYFDCSEISQTLNKGTLE